MLSEPAHLSYVGMATYYLLEIAKGFERQGWKVDVVTNSEETKSNIKDYLNNTPPAFCFSSAFTGWEIFEDSEWGFDKYATPYCQTLESPWSFHTQIHQTSYNHVIFHVDPPVIDKIKKHETDGAIHHPTRNWGLTLNLETHTEMPVFAHKNTGRDIDVLFVGNLRDSMFEYQMSNYPRPLRKLAEKIVEVSFQRNIQPLFKICEDAISTNQIDVDLEGMAVYQFIRNVDLMTRFQRRVRILESLKKYRVHVVSNVEPGFENFTWQKPCSWPEIQKLTDRAKVVIADMPSHTDAVNERVLCGLAQNAFVISFANDRMIRLFEDHENLVMFDLQDEQYLPALVGHYLDRPKDRARIAEAGGDKVRSEFTYKQAARHFLDHLTGGLPVSA